MSRLFALVCAMVLVEGSLFTALGPLLPHLRAEFGLSASQAGLLAAAYVIGAVIATVPAAVGAVRLGVKATAAVGLGVLGGMSLGFAFGATYPELVATQLAAGIGAGVMWVAAMTWLIDVTPAERRGEVIGTAFGVSAVG
jgi:putative MFS transporter